MSSFKRDVRHTFPARDFDYDTERHVQNLRAVEVFLETPQDWFRLLEKAGLPVSTDLRKDITALVFYQGQLWFWDGTQFKALADSTTVAEATSFVSIYKWAVD